MISRNILSSLPPWLSRWFGYRSSPSPPQPAIVIYLWSFLGAFIGISIIQAIFTHSSYFTSRNVPTIVASYGASAVLCYGSIDVPLAQPRALVGGHFFSALSGLFITKLFRLLSVEKFESLRWLAGSLSTAVAISVMAMTKTTHPPAGATALLVAVDNDIWRLSWYYLPVVLLSSTIILVSALLVNNVQRRYPTFWWAPVVPTQDNLLKGEETPQILTGEVKERDGRVNGVPNLEV